MIFLRIYLSFEGAQKRTTFLKQYKPPLHQINVMWYSHIKEISNSSFWFFQSGSLDCVDSYVVRVDGKHCFANPQSLMLLYFTFRKKSSALHWGSAAVEQPETRLSIRRGVTAEIWAMCPPMPQESLFLRGAAELTRAMPLWLEWHRRRALKMAPSARGSRCLLTPLNWVDMIHSDFLLAARSKPTNRWENFTPASTVRNCTVRKCTFKLELRDADKTALKL